jgi:DNA replication and repair protein RecF
MIIENIKLRNFRNYTNCDLDISDTINVFVGDNAQGKTNFLESVAFISATRSFRTNNDRDMIKLDNEFAQVTLILNDNDSRLKLTGQIFKEGKRLLIQNQPTKKASEFIGTLNAVVFAPDDLELFDGAPKLRRRLCDLEIGKINKEYMQILNQYQKTLKERNAFLKAESKDDVYLEVLTEKLIEQQVVLINRRKTFIDEINKQITTKYQKIAETKDLVRIEYLAPVEDYSTIEESLNAKYKKHLAADRYQKQTQIGIHKDDLRFYLNEQLVSGFASQGQKRMIVLALKIVLIDYIYERKHSYPVLLLDDVLSELDITRKRSLFTLIPQQIQTIITTTDINDIKDYLPKKTRIFKINNGKIIETKEMV